MTFGEKIQKLRRESGLSQEQLAEELQVSRQAVSKWETGDSLPDSSRILMLSRKFGVSTDYLLKDEIEISEIPDSARIPEEIPKSRRGRGFLIAGSITGGLGAMGFLVTALLSGMIESRVNITYESGGRTWYTSGLGYSFTGFVETFRLQGLLVLFGLLIAAGAALLGIWLEKRREIPAPEPDGGR